MDEAAASVKVLAAEAELAMVNWTVLKELDEMACHDHHECRAVASLER